MLCFASDSIWNTVKGLPSWVPDWSCHAKPKRLLWRTPFREESVFPSMEGSEGSVKVSADGRLLMIREILIDPIKVTGSPWPPRSSKPLTITGTGRKLPERP